MACGRRLIAYFAVAVICLFFTSNSEVNGQLNLYITKEDLNSDMSKYFGEFQCLLGRFWSASNLCFGIRPREWTVFGVPSFAGLNFKTDVYIIKDGMPAELLRSPKALYSLVSPISPVVTEVQFSWYSTWPQVRTDVTRHACW